MALEYRRRGRHGVLSPDERRALKKLPLRWMATAIAMVVVFLDGLFTLMLANNFMISTGATLLTLLFKGKLGTFGLMVSIITLMCVLGALVIDRILYRWKPAWIGRWTVLVAAALGIAFYALLWPSFSYLVFS